MLNNEVANGVDHKVAIIISPNWRDYAKKYLDDCLGSIKQQDWTGESKIFLIDNETSEESYSYLKNKVDQFSLGNKTEIIRNKDNDGFAKGNNEGMKAAIDQGYDYLILFNMDTIVDKSAVSELVKTAETEPNAGVVQSKLLLWPDKEKINSLGNATHFLGFGYCKGYGKSVTDYQLSITSQEIFYPSGAAFLIKSEVVKKIGYFDERFWMYNEDQDLGWRVWLAGYRCLLAPDSVVYHKYEFSRSITKYYWMDRNRLIVILKNFHLLTLLLILPPLAFMELGLFLFAWKGGWLKEKLNVYKYFLKIDNWRYILTARQNSQKLRKIKDREVVKMITGKIWYQEVDDWKLRAINPIFDLYWRIVKLLIVW